MSLCDNCIHKKVCRWEVPNDTPCDDYIGKHQLDDWLCFPHTIDNITFYNKNELINWLETQQTINKERNEEQVKSIYRFLEEYDGVPVVNPTF
jgi:hypothetical protein